MSDQSAPAMDAQALDSIAQGDGWWGKWRAVQAWELTFETPLAAGCALYSLMHGNVFVVDALVKLTPLITVYMGARYAVLGVHVWRGSQERQLAISTSTSTTTATASSTIKSPRAD